jgi:transposase IS66 family protein
VRYLTERTNAPSPSLWARSSWPTKKEPVRWLQERIYRATEGGERKKVQSHLRPSLRCPRLEPYDGKPSRTVLRGLGGRKAPWLPDHFRAGEFGREELQRRLIPLQARMGRLLRRGEASPDRKAAGLCRELRKCWPALWTFARVAGVEPTNNGAERALRPAVLWRKGSFGSNSEAGSRFVERLLTVVATCRQQGRSLLDFLVAAGEAALQGTAGPSLLAAGQGAE